MINSKKIWTTDDDEFLLDSYGNTGMRYMVRELQRSEDAIRLRHKELTGTMDMHIAGGYITPRYLASVIGVDQRTVVYWIQESGLKAKQFHKNIKGDKNRYRYFIDPYDFWNWLENNKQRVNFSHIERGVLLPEPYWLDDEIRKATSLKRPKSWTEEEDELAWMLWQGGVNYRDIARCLNRPEKGTQRRLTAIRKRKNERHVKTH